MLVVKRCCIGGRQRLSGFANTAQFVAQREQLHIDGYSKREQDPTRSIDERFRHWVLMVNEMLNVISILTAVIFTVAAFLV